jgi:helix-turn-helix protein
MTTPENGHSAGTVPAIPRAQRGRRGRAEDRQSEAPAPRRRLVGLEEASRVLGISPWSCRELAWRGELPRVRLPGIRKWLVAEDDLHRLIDRSRQ